MAGGVLAGIIGLQTRPAHDGPRAAAPVRGDLSRQAVVAVLAMLVLAGVKLPPIVEMSTEGARPLGEIVC